MAVRSVQLMVDRGELSAWKTPGGHRRILRDSVDRWRAERGIGTASGGPRAATAPPAAARSLPEPRPVAAAPDIDTTEDRQAPAGAARVLLIEDSKHFQNLISLLLRQHFPGAELHVADDGIAGLAMAGQLQPHVLIVDILLPGIDGATLIGSLSMHPQFAASRLVVVTSLDEAQREPYAFALKGVPVVHKPRLVAELPPLLHRLLQPQAAHV
jgi:excisionase family DNA binding protein